MLPLITALEASSLNLSPLKEIHGVLFVSSAKELGELFNGIDNLTNNISQNEDYFYLDSQLPRWKDFLVKSDKIDMDLNVEEV